ncbi:hypothetical protein BT69DRAFT_1271937, partial [Atractiella rhizophila]
MAGITIAAKGLDLSARVIDLFAGPLATPIISWSVELCEWIGREGVNRESLSTTLELVKDFAHPNKTGVDLLDDQVTTANRTFGLNLVQPRALGQTILSSIHLQWMAMTEAVAMSYHDLDYVVHLLTRIILAQVDKRHWVVFETRIRPVITKMVSSIALHLRSFPQPPQELAQVAKHYMAAEALADAVIAIRQHEQDNLVVCAEYCPIDLLMWLLYHWAGSIEVSY